MRMSAPLPLMPLSDIEIRVWSVTLCVSLHHCACPYQLIEGWGSARHIVVYMPHRIRNSKTINLEDYISADPDMGRVTGGYAFQISVCDSSVYGGSNSVPNDSYGVIAITMGNVGGAKFKSRARENWISIYTVLSPHRRSRFIIHATGVSFDVNASVQFIMHARFHGLSPERSTEALALC